MSSLHILVTQLTCLVLDTYAANIGSTPEYDLISTTAIGEHHEDKEVKMVEKGSTLAPHFHLLLALAFVFFILILTIFISKRKRRNRKKADDGETRRSGWFKKEEKYAPVPEGLLTIPESDDDELTFGNKASLCMEEDSADSDDELVMDGVFKI